MTSQPPIRTLIDLVATADTGILLEKWYEQVRSLDDLVAHRDDFIANPGVDSDLGQMMEMNPNIAAMDDSGRSEAEIRAAWFDHVVKELRIASRSGVMRLYRMLASQDVQGFIAATEAGHPLGSHWTHNANSATSSYHTGDLPPGVREVLLVADAPLASIDWFTTMQANFSQPYEQEVFVIGPVRLLSIGTDLNGKDWSYTPQRGSYQT
jgi:hypothetical protein